MLIKIFLFTYIYVKSKIKIYHIFNFIVYPEMNKGNVYVENYITRGNSWINRLNSIWTLFTSKINSMTLLLVIAVILFLLQ